MRPWLVTTLRPGVKELSKRLFAVARLACHRAHLIKSTVLELESCRQVRLEPMPIGDSLACWPPPHAGSELKNGLLDM